MPSPEACATAATIVDDVLCHGHSLDRATSNRLKRLPPEHRPEIREIAWGSVRWTYRYLPLLRQKLHKPVRPQDSILENLMLCAFYQYEHLDEPDYAITSGTVDAATLLGRGHARGLVNGVLRAHLRNPEPIIPEQEEARFATPNWLLSCIRRAWPDDWQDILTIYNSRPLMTLRVNCQFGSRDDYLACLADAGFDASASTLSPWAITLGKPRPVLDLPGFSDGHVSVQDAAAQLSTRFLGDLHDLRVLEACAAPGGKTGQLIEVATGTTSITAVDLPERTHFIEENIDRIQGTARVISGDVTEPQEWWDDEPYDRIILDAPCSGSGVIRRHPDIRILRRESDIPDLARKQLLMVQRLWPLLKRGGCLLYVTCSILPAENDAVIKDVLGSVSDASPGLLDCSRARKTQFGCQFLPNSEGDGLYYAILQKR